MDSENHPICSSNINVITSQWFWVIYTSAKIMEVLLIILTYSSLPSEAEDLEQHYFWLSHPYF